jgi:hypothetical protein
MPDRIELVTMIKQGGHVTKGSLCQISAGRFIVVMSIALGFMLGPSFEQPAYGSVTSMSNGAGVVKAQFCGSGAPVYRPTGAPWRCLNHAGIYGIRWSSWTEHGATGQGTVEIDGCVPGCISDSKWGHFPARLILGARKHVDGTFRFSKMSVYFLGKVPYGYRKSTEIPLVAQSSSGAN